jgi:hypothetical protein
MEPNPYEAPHWASTAKRPKRLLWQPLWPIVLGAILVLVGLAYLHALYVESLKLGKEASPPADGGTMAVLATITLLALVSGSWLILRTSLR